MKGLQSVFLVALFASTNAFSTSSLSTTTKHHVVGLSVLPESERVAAVESDMRQGRRGVLGGCLSYLAASAILAMPAMAATKDLKEDYRQGTAALADMDSSAPVPKEAYKKLDSGVIYADLFKGAASAPTVEQGSKVTLEWVLRRSNGYFVDSSAVVGTPFIFTVGSGQAIKGIDEGMRGMKQGGTRRILVPPRLAFVDGLGDDKPGPMPAGFGPRQQMKRIQSVKIDVPGEYIYFEVQVTRVR